MSTTRWLDTQTRELNEAIKSFMGNVASEITQRINDKIEAMGNSQ